MTTVSSHIQAAVDRGLAGRQQAALAEVQGILDAALRVAERVAPDTPRVADIVAEAGSSNQAFYRYFASKHDLMLAVMERGLQRVHSYLAHQMAKHARPQEQVEAWAEGLLGQLTHPTAPQALATVRQLHLAGRQHDPASAALTDQLGNLLVEPLRELGVEQPELDARALLDATMGCLHRHVAHGSTLNEAEKNHLIRFCLRAAVVPEAGRDASNAVAR